MLARPASRRRFGWCEHVLNAAYNSNRDTIIICHFSPAFSPLWTFPPSNTLLGSMVPIGSLRSTDFS